MCISVLLYVAAPPCGTIILSSVHVLWLLLELFYPGRRIPLLPLLSSFFDFIRTEGVVCWTNCKASCGEFLFMILGCINKWNWLNTIFVCIETELVTWCRNKWVWTAPRCLAWRRNWSSHLEQLWTGTDLKRANPCGRERLVFALSQQVDIALGANGVAYQRAETPIHPDHLSHTFLPTHPKASSCLCKYQTLARR